MSEISSNEESYYKPLTDQELTAQWEEYRQLIHNFFDDNDFDKKYIFVNESTMYSIIAKVDQRKQYFRYFHKLEMSELKEVALNAFWIIKLKPLGFDRIDGEDIQTDIEEDYLYLNEKLAFYKIFKTLRAIAIEKKKDEKVNEILNSLPVEYVNELIYTFTYRDISKEALILLVETMAAFMGINPYQESNKKS